MQRADSGREEWLVSGAIREAAERGVRLDISIHPRPVTGELMALLLNIAPLRNDEGRLELQGRFQEMEDQGIVVVTRDVILLRLQKWHALLHCFAGN